MTSCTCRRTPYFADPQHAEEMAAQIVPTFAMQAFEVVVYCVMPDHVHVLLEGQTDDADFRRAVRVWKLVCGHRWRMSHDVPLWQVGYFDRVLREEDDTRAVVGYILNNPVRAGLAVRAVEYPFSGSARYSLEELAEHAGDWNPPWKTRRGHI